MTLFFPILNVNYTYERFFFQAAISNKEVFVFMCLLFWQYTPSELKRDMMLHPCLGQL